MIWSNVFTARMGKLMQNVSFYMRFKTIYAIIFLQQIFKAEVTNMRPAKEFPAAREYLARPVLLNIFPRLIFAMRYQKLSP